MNALIGLFKTMRPKQWTKNAIVFAGLVFDGQLFHPDPFLRVLICFFLFCFLSGAVYVINDLVDIERDRAHPTKRNRPLPSGKLPVPFAIGGAVVILVLVFVIALVMRWQFAVVLATYLVLQLLYSFVLKHIVILDVLALTGGFVLRVAAGVVVIQVAEFSPWLYACTALLSLFLSIGKRRQELLLMAERSGNTRVTLEQYNLPLLDDMLRMVMTGTLIAYLLYTIEVPSVLLAGTKLAITTVPFVLYGMFRYLYLIHVKGEGSAPDEVLLKDRPLQIAIALWGLAFVLILYVAPGLMSTPPL
ncbi:MAG: decaprenyl-phosphate phosphoribosyltransferase [Anaerolineae bacterium]